MPRVRINKKRDMDKDLYSWIEGERKRKGMNQTQLGKELGYSQQVISKKIHSRQFTTYDLICIFSLFDTEPDTISKLLKENK